MSYGLDVKLNCLIKFEEDKVYLYLQINNNVILQFFDITKEYNEFVETNFEYEIYSNDEKIVAALEKGYVDRYMELETEDEQLKTLLALRVDMLHKLKKCGHTCILCNPNLGPDPFPNFSLYLDAIEHEGEA